MPIEAPDDLICLAEIADLLDVTYSAVSNWRKRRLGFPEPWGTWRCGSLWVMDEVIEWSAGRESLLAEASMREAERHERAAARSRARAERLTARAARLTTGGDGYGNDDAQAGG